MSDPRLPYLTAINRKALWLSTWTIHNANHLRDSELKVGGHKASSASMCTILTALYFHALRPEDRVAVKPHASPVFHAAQYLIGRLSREQLENFRSFGGGTASSGSSASVSVTTGSGAFSACLIDSDIRRFCWSTLRTLTLTS